MAIDWLVENLRLSLFSNAPVQVTEADWQSLTGQKMADTRQAIPGGHVFTGRYQEAQMNLAGTANRADIIMISPPPEPTDEQQLPIFGSWTATRDKFVQLTQKSPLAERFPVIRIAFGAVLLGKANSKVDAYKDLKSLLSSVAVDPEGMSDFNYRVNWPLPSKVQPDLLINRITNWSAIQVQIAQVTVDGQSVTGASTAPTNAVRLEIDHNTGVGRKEPFATDVVQKLYRELVELASENTAKGERP